MRIVWPASVALVLLAGCSSGGHSSDATTFAQQYCAMFDSCCGTNTSWMAESASSKAVCEANIASSSIDLDPSQACLAALQSESANGTLCVTAGTDIPACYATLANNAAVNGSTPPGGSCESFEECTVAPGTTGHCVQGSGGAATCVQAKLGLAGDGPCVGSDGVDWGASGQDTWYGTGPAPGQGYVCSQAGGFTCSPATQKCVALSTTGEPCQWDVDCVTTDYCQSTCTPRVGAGAACTGVYSCLPPSLCDGTTCSPSSTLLTPIAALCNEQ